MPQATLLSYFAKPVTSSVPIQFIPQKNGHLDSGRSDASIRVSPSRKQGIVEAARLQASLRVSKQELGCSSVGKEQQANDATIKSRDHDRMGNYSPSSRSGHLETAAVSHLPEAAISFVSEEHLQSIRRLTATTLPVRYSDGFFTQTITDPVAKQLSRVALYKSEPIGWIRCRLEPCTLNSFVSQPDPPLSQIYIQALALLSPYRGLGLATLLLEAMLSSGIALAQSTICIYAHVWEKNEDALDWYAKRGFKRIMLVEHYYRKLRPSGAWIVRRELHDT